MASSLNSPPSIPSSQTLLTLQLSSPSEPLQRNLRRHRDPIPIPPELLLPRRHVIILERLSLILRRERHLRRALPRSGRPLFTGQQAQSGRVLLRRLASRRVVFLVSAAPPPVRGPELVRGGERGEAVLRGVRGQRGGAVRL